MRNISGKILLQKLALKWEAGMGAFSSGLTTVNCTVQQQNTLKILNSLTFFKLFSCITFSLKQSLRKQTAKQQQHVSSIFTD